MIEVSTSEFSFLKNIFTDTPDFDSFVYSNTIGLQSIIDNAKETDSRKTKVFDLLFTSKGSIPINAISEKAFWSNRQISRYFKKHFGLSAKEYANILRIHATYKDLAQGNTSPKTDFFDQSHFIKETKKYTGTTPKQLVKNENDRFLQLSKKKKT